MLRAISISVTCLFLATTLRAGEIKTTRDIVYERVDDKDYKLDVVVPQGDGPFPLVLAIHGGAWRIGDKSKLTPFCEELARHGYVAATLNYRFAPKYKWPSQLDDAKAALLFLKRHAKEYKIDVTRVGGTGESAGSQLIMLMAFMPDPPNATPLTSTHMKAVANYYGPVDLSQWHAAPLVEYLWQKRFHENMDDAMADFLGTHDKQDPKVKAASPITYVCDGGCCPPVLTFHGTLDPLVPYHQAEELHEALRKAHVPEDLEPIPNGLHGGWAPDAKKAADDKAIAFFDQYLKGDKQVAATQPARPEVAGKGTAGDGGPKRPTAVH